MQNIYDNQKYIWHAHQQCAKGRNGEDDAMCMSGTHNNSVIYTPKCGPTHTQIWNVFLTENSLSVEMILDDSR